MCDPLSLIMGGLSAASSVASAVTQQNAQKKQEQANNQWMQYQRQQRLAENRVGRTCVRRSWSRETVQDLSPEAQEGTGRRAVLPRRRTRCQGQRELHRAAAGKPADVNAALLSGQSAGGPCSCRTWRPVSRHGRRQRKAQSAGGFSPRWHHGRAQTRSALEPRGASGHQPPEQFQQDLPGLRRHQAVVSRIQSHLQPMGCWRRGAPPASPVSGAARLWAQLLQT
jgi:hypothetical protein